MFAHQILWAAGQTWPPFVLVAGLLLVGAVAAADALFEAVGARLACSPLGPRALLLALLTLVAVVTAVLNLDTAVVFLTPVLVHSARLRRLDERPFLYGSVFMANSGSLLLPGSNLTNLLVLRANAASGANFAAHMLGPWIAVCGLTATFIALVFPLRSGNRTAAERPQLQFGIGASGIVAATAAMLALPNPALPVFGIGLATTAVRRLRPRLDVRPFVVLFGFATALGACARVWLHPAQALAAHGASATAAIGAVSSVVLNNLPAAVLFSAEPPLHPHALLLGLDLGPNLAVTGSLSGLLWLKAARGVGAAASISTYSRLGAFLVPLTLVAALAAST